MIWANNFVTSLWDVFDVSYEIDESICDDRRHCNRST